MYYFFAAAAICILGYFYFQRGTRIIYIKKLLLPAICIIFTLCLIIFSKTAITAALKGLKLWLEIVVPSLFPFFIASELLNKSGFIKSAGILLEPVMRPMFNIPGAGSFAFLMGITSGYPVGAKITSDLYSDGILTSNEAERLLAFSNNSGPLFIIGAVSVGMYKKPALGLLFLLCHIAAGITVGLIYKFNSKKQKQRKNASEKRNVFSKFKRELMSTNSSNFGSLLGCAVNNSIHTILMIGGFIIFFCVLINLLLETGAISSISGLIASLFSPFGVEKQLIEAVLSGVFELTTGNSLVSSLAQTPLYIKLMASSFIIGWAGLSVHAQVLSIVSQKGLSIKPYIFGKFLQGLIAAFYTMMFYHFTGEALLGSKEVFMEFTQGTAPHWHQSLLFSLLVLAIIVGFFIFLSLIGLFIKPGIHKNKVY